MNAVQNELQSLSDLSDDNLFLLCEIQDWEGPAYHLRWRWKDRIPSLSDDQLMLLIQTQSPAAKKEAYHRAKASDYKASDEVLVLMTQDGDDTAKEVLITGYIRNVEKNINRMEQQGRFLKSYDTDDLVHEGIIGLFKAIRDFKVEKRTKFKIFARHVIKKHIDSLILQSSNKKLGTLNDAFSYHTPIGGSESDLTFEQLLKSESYQPEDILIKHETFYALWENFTPLERVVLWYYAEDYSYQQIGDLAIPGNHKTDEQKRKTVDNTIQRFKKKRREYELLFKD